METDKQRNGALERVTIGKNTIPMALSKLDGNDIVASTFDNANYLFLDYLEGVVLSGEYTYSYFGTLCSVVAMDIGDSTALYYVVDQRMVPICKAILALLSRHFTGDYAGSYGGWCSTESVLSSLASISAAKPVVRIPVDRWHTLGTAKISGEHHLHFDAVQVISSLRGGELAKARAAERLPATATTTAVAGYALWLSQLGDKFHDAVTHTGLLDQESLKDVAAVGKKISVRCKSWQGLLEDDMRPLFEIDVLVNRDVGSVDWAAEKQHRTDPALAKVSKSTVYNEAMKLFAQRDRTAQDVKRMDWQTFWTLRWQWSASGSIHSQYPEDTEGMPKSRELKNKFINLIMQDKKKLEDYLSRDPSIHAWSSTKYEWGKMRAIYGTDLTSYLMAHFAFFNCEEVLPSAFPVGSKARESFVRAKVGSVLHNLVPLCIDFEDFNSMHSIENMQAVIRAYRDAFRGKLSREQVMAVDWTHDSIANTVVHDNMGTKTEYKAMGTLMSGWRLTTFMNSVLNFIYTKVMFKGAKATRRSVHNGDDVLLGVDNFVTVTEAVRTATSYNIRLQRSKCAFGGMAEFLRVDHSLKGNGQYLTRNIATLMHSRIESTPAVSVTDLIAAMDMRLEEYTNRGGSGMSASALKEDYLSRVGARYGLSLEDMYRVKAAHKVSGGISNRRDAEVKYTVVETPVTQETELPLHIPGVVDYAKAIAGELKIHEKIEYVIKEMRRATLRAVMMVHYNVKITTSEDLGLLNVLRAISGSYRDVNKSPVYGKSAMIGYLMEVRTEDHKVQMLQKRVMNSVDPLAMIRILV